MSAGSVLSQTAEHLELQQSSNPARPIGQMALQGLAARRPWVLTCSETKSDQSDGSGKTILAEQYVFANATAERPALYLSTVAEPFDKLIRYGQTLSFFDANTIGRSVFTRISARP